MPKPPPTSRPLRPDVFRFLDAREFLRRAYDAEKAVNPDFSHRAIARRMKARSSSFFRDVIDGRIRIGSSRAAGFARLFGLNRTEAEYFTRLVPYTEAEDESERAALLERLLEVAPAGNRTYLGALQMEYFRKWQYAAVRELLALGDFGEEPQALGSLLDPPLTAHETAESLRLLQRLKLIRRNARGRLEKSDRIVSSGPAHPERVRPALRDNLQLALRALDVHPPKARPFSYLTLSLSEKSLEQIRERLRGLRGEILDIVGRDDSVDRLYQLNLQLFPLSRPVPRRRTA